MLFVQPRGTGNIEKHIYSNHYGTLIKRFQFFHKRENFVKMQIEFTNARRQ